MLRRTFSRSLIALSLGLTFGQAAVAQTYPSRPITMVVPWAPVAAPMPRHASWLR